MSINIKYNIPLSDITFYGIGGHATEVWEIDSVQDFTDIWAETIEQKTPKIVIGKGSNTIFSDRGFLGRVFIPFFDKTLWKNNIVTVEAGKSFQEFIEETNQKAFKDFCNLSGIPGTVGGFIRGNAGALGIQTAEFCIGVEYLDESGQIQKIDAKNCDFGYRESVFKNHPDWCIVRVTFELKPVEGDIDKNRTQALEKTKEILKQRWKKNPAGRSGGCIFKNPPGAIAGKLLDECGAKGDIIGDAQISTKHANFFLNRGKAKQQDIISLARKWKEKVQEEKGIVLETEVFICDEVGMKLVL